MTASIVSKRDVEAYGFELDFTGNLPEGTLIVSGTASAKAVADGSNADSDILESTALTIDNGKKKATVSLKANSTVGMFRVSYLLTLSSGGPIEDDIIVQSYSR